MFGSIHITYLFSFGYWTSCCLKSNPKWLASSFYQQEIGDVAASAEHRFFDQYPNLEDWTSQRVDDIVDKAVTRAKVHFKSELKKILSIADPQNTPAFLAEVKTHYESHDDGVEMKLEKLWMLAVSAMDPFMKVLWLERWNLTPNLRT